ncbi:uncharacterized protein F5891DRAFT_1195667 [Suillus fuscotomentosus]|uniref:Uncharacterized protein n=1 Tax=Suillus fuscotomentosus TaxID=1912939 RepID=A0AAD4DUC8_9AGAM|nr:uncharacterized protein F5891DRAFT_1195667 [Suillus fuscotomentosus]KAG1894110.1 hypothetical protein F5891DRAFT_1195667 [Suillus fuscotomentosus]
MEQSTAATIFWTLDQMKEMAAELAIAETLAEPNGMVGEPCVAICGKLLHILRHHEYLNHYGRPEARLIRSHSVSKRRRDLEDSPLMTGIAVTMLYIPIMVLKRLRSIYVDGLVNGVDMRGFTDDFSVQAKSQTTVASVIMAVDASILAIPGLGSQLTTKTMCSISFILSVYCIIGCTMAQHFGQRLRSLDFAAYYLQGKLSILVILTSIPSFLYLMSLTFATLGFLAVRILSALSVPVLAKCSLVLGSKVKRASKADHVQQILQTFRSACSDFGALSPASAAERLDITEWTTTHAFFAWMGGFMLYFNDKPRATLTPDKLLHFVHEGSVEMPIIVEADMEDRSKGDAFISELMNKLERHI